MTRTANSDLTLADLVRADAARAKVLDSYRLHYCCDGDSTLEEATANADVDLDEVLAALALPKVSGRSTVAPGARPDLAALTDRIVERHHGPLWGELLRVQDLVDTVARVHGWRHPELRRLRELYAAFAADMGPHMVREERVVFPAIQQLEATRRPVETAQGPLRDLLEELVGEHDVTGALLNEMHRITRGFATPVDGCSTYRDMNTALRALERRLHALLHEENNLLFPAVRQLDAEVCG